MNFIIFASMKLIYFISTIVFVLFSNISVNAQQISPDTLKFYDAKALDFCKNYFDNNSSLSNDTLKKIKSGLLCEAPVQYANALMNYSVQTIVNDYKLMIASVDELLPILNKEQYPHEYAMLLLLKGKTYLNTGYYYIEAHHFINEAIELFDPDKDLFFLGLAYSQLGSLWRDMQEYDKALECCIKSEEIYRQAGYEREAYNMRLNECIIYLEMKDGEKIINIIREDLPWAELHKDTIHLEFLYVILGHYYNLENKPDSAYFFFNEALELDANSGRRAYTLANIGEVFFNKHDYEKARYYLENAMPFTHEANRIQMESKVMEMLAEIYYEENAQEKAYTYLQKATLLKDSLALQEKANELHRTQTKTELMHYQQELQIAKQQAEINRTYFYLLILVFLLALVIFFFISFHLNRKKKIKEMENTQLAQKMQLDEMEHRQKIEEKEREMATTQLLIAEKSNVLENLLEVLKPYHESNELPKKMWKEIETFMAMNTNKESEWEKSKVHFEKVHPDFFKRLKELAPDLSENELRACAYIRIGMTTKQIADILSVTQRSVISNRYRIRKKTNLEEKKSLEEFIRNI